MAAKKIITILVLLSVFFLQLTAEDKPKKSKLRAVTHWVATHKMAIAISAGTAAATGFALHNSAAPNHVLSPVNVFQTKCMSNGSCGVPPAPPTP